MKKNEIRDAYKEKRLALSTTEIEKFNDLMLIQFQKLQIDIPELVMTYSPIKTLNEFDPQLITDYCYFKNPGQQLFYPAIVNDYSNIEMTAVAVDDDTLFEINKYGIEEPVNGINMIPSEIDMIIVPLLCFDSVGNRVGYGKGYYDRFLKQCRRDCLKIGFSYFENIEQIEDINANDIKLNYCITPYKTFAF